MPRNTPLKAIRKKCLECSGGDKQEVRKCFLHQCPLFPYRLGHDPEAPVELPIEARDPEEGQSPREKKRTAVQQYTLF